jgi:hypothetical protein
MKFKVGDVLCCEGKSENAGGDCLCFRKKCFFVVAEEKSWNGSDDMCLSLLCLSSETCASAISNNIHLFCDVDLEEWKLEKIESIVP